MKEERELKITFDPTLKDYFKTSFRRFTRSGGLVLAWILLILILIGLIGSFMRRVMISKRVRM